MTGSHVADTSTMSAECGVAQRPEYTDLHRDCRRTVDVPLPGAIGIVLVPRCTCSCHPYSNTTRRPN